MIIPNQSDLQFDYVLPDGSTLPATAESNIVTTETLTDSVSKIKSSNKTFMQEGETAVQTVVITNNSHTTLFDQQFRDSMTSGATYVAGSVVVNGVAQPGYDLVSGFPLPTLAPNQSVTVSYTILANNPVTQTPVQNFGMLTYSVDDPIRGTTVFHENTNTVEIAIVSNRISVVKSVDKAFAIRGDILHYTTVVTNTGTLDKINLVFTDEIPVGTTFVAGSVKINGTPFPAYHPQTGFPLPNLTPGNSVTVEFDVEVS